MPSPSSSASSAGSAPSQENDEPTLPQLVSFFVSAKRSILSTSHVVRAHEIVNAARGLLEENAILSARNAYTLSTVDDQAVTLAAIEHGVVTVREEALAELQSLLSTLDTANTRLQKILTRLKKTEISSELQTADKAALFDFVDFSNYTNLQDSLRACIDRFGQGRISLDEVMKGYSRTLNTLRDALTSVRSTPATTAPSPLPPLFRELEGHATDIAHNLQSLVHHYDLCVNALKHTEGGLPAASEATGDVPDVTGISIESLHHGAPPAPMTSSERLDMLRVVGKDASEVEDVVAEMRDRAADMEDHLKEMENYVSQLRSEHATLLSAVQMLGEVGKDTRSFIGAAKSFLAIWAEERLKLEQGIDDVESFKEFYEGFLEAYDNVLLELDRRKQMEEEGERIAREAEAQFAQLYEADLAARVEFKQNLGDFIPSDLWPGVVNLPPRYQIIVAPEDSEPRETEDAAQQVVASEEFEHSG